MLEQITNVWSGVLTWITTSMGSLQAVFYDSTSSSLTFLGVIATVSVSIGICLLIFNKVRDFLRLQ